MSSLPHTVVTWTEFLRLPERPENAKRYELHDGEVVIVPLPRPLHMKVQRRLLDLLEPLARRRGVATTEFRYRPAPNLQYWVADVAYVPQAEWDAIPPDKYPIYTPPLIVEISHRRRPDLRYLTLTSSSISATPPPRLRRQPATSCG
jgi:Uma2 family endonuclease